MINYVKIYSKVIQLVLNICWWECWKMINISLKKFNIHTQITKLWNQSYSPEGNEASLLLNLESDCAVFVM